jgi:hypothetical protein
MPMAFEGARWESAKLFLVGIDPHPIGHRVAGDDLDCLQRFTREARDLLASVET